MAAQLTESEPTTRACGSTGARKVDCFLAALWGATVGLAFLCGVLYGQRTGPRRGNGGSNGEGERVSRAAL